MQDWRVRAGRVELRATKAANASPARRANTGEYSDGYGNQKTVYAMANPAQFPAEPRFNQTLP
jgi:hypothetical protein